MITVTTEEELKKALKNKEPEIEVIGPLAKKLIRQRKIRKGVTYGSLATGAAALVAAPFTGGLSMYGFGFAAATLTGTDIVMLVAVAGVIGLGFLGLLLGYEAEFNVMGNRVKFTRK